MEYLRNDNILTISTSYSYDGVCTCGEKNFGYDDGLWCCKSSQGSCTIEEYYASGKVVTCHGSQALDLKNQCHTKSSTTSGVCNHYPSDEGRNHKAKRSYLNLCLDDR